MYDFKEIDEETRVASLHLCGTMIVSRGRIHQLQDLPGFCMLIEGEVQAAIYYYIVDGQCEIVSLDSRRENIGAGTKLIELVLEEAERKGCSRIWLITSNDNTRAIRFYQKRGFDLKAVHIDAITEARKLKSSIPVIGYDGIPVRHEVEFEYKS